MKTFFIYTPPLQSKNKSYELLTQDEYLWKAVFLNPLRLKFFKVVFFGLGRPFFNRIQSRTESESFTRVLRLTMFEPFSLSISMSINLKENCICIALPWPVGT